MEINYLDKQRVLEGIYFFHYSNYWSKELFGLFFKQILEINLIMLKITNSI